MAIKKRAKISFLPKEVDEMELEMEVQRVVDRSQRAERTPAELLEDAYRGGPPMDRIIEFEG